MNASLEPTATELSSRQLLLEELIYNTSTCYVYRAWDRRRNLPVVLKFLLMPVNEASSEAMQREVENQLACRHPNIVEILDSFWYFLSSTTWVAVLELERMMKDLIKDIQDRYKNKFPYDEDTLSGYFRTLVDVFAFAQDRGIAHRDVKPHNLFLSGSTLKVGDFGSSRHVPHNPLYLSLVGTPSYLSPLLREGLSANRSYIAHNPFKSDVYSFGLTILHMATLQCLSPFEDLNTAVQRAINGYQCSESMKAWLRWILTFDEANRPDFIEIRKALQGDTSHLQTIIRDSCLACEHDQALSSMQLSCYHSLCQDCFEARLVYLPSCMQIVCPVCDQHTEYLFAPTSVMTTGSGVTHIEKINVQKKPVHVKGNSVAVMGTEWTSEVTVLSPSPQKRPVGQGCEEGSSQSAQFSMSSLPSLNLSTPTIVAARPTEEVNHQAIWEALVRKSSISRGS